MNIPRWIARREPNWQQLDALLKQVEKKSIRSLNSGQICQMAGLYRSVAADLARAKTHQVGNLLIQDLQKLTARAYTQVYQGSRPQDWQGVIEFWRWGLPAVVRETWVYTAWATGIFLTTALVAWWYAWGDPVFMSLMVSQSLISQVRDRQELWMGSIVGVEPWASSNIMVNNLSVAFKAVAGGITGGDLYDLYFRVKWVAYWYDSDFSGSASFSLSILGVCVSSWCFRITGNFSSRGSGVINWESVSLSRGIPAPGCDQNLWHSSGSIIIWCGCLINFGRDY